MVNCGRSSDIRYKSSRNTREFFNKHLVGHIVRNQRLIDDRLALYLSGSEQVKVRNQVVKCDTMVIVTKD